MKILKLRMIRKYSISSMYMVCAFCLLFSVFHLFVPYPSWGQGPSRITVDTTSPQKLTLIVGKSIIIKSSEQVKRVSVVAPEIADALVLTAWQISLIGKAPGVTNVTLWGISNKVFSILDLEVSPDVSRLEETIHKIFPEERNIRVSATHDNITLSGSVSSTSRKEQIMSLAESYFPKKVVDLLRAEPSNTDIARLEEMIHKVLPEEKDVRVTAADGKVAISGMVSSKTRAEQIQALAESYFPKRVVNLLQVEVPPESSSLRASRFNGMVCDILPDEKDIRVNFNNGSITLSGKVSSTANLSHVVKLAESFLPKEGKIINLLAVSGVHQVMLEVRVAEMSRSLQRRLGFNFSYITKSGNNLGLSLLNKLVSLPPNGFPANPLIVSDSVTGIFRFMSHDTSWTFFIDALKENGLLKVLAEPTLIALSGKTANFLAGGEFPVPIPQSGTSNTITIEYKPFGVGLNFTPTVLSSNKISMRVAPEVSELDFSNAIQISGFVIPSITTRRASTEIELADGQSFAIAGLLRDEVREDIKKFPVLGEIPILGALFNSSSFQKNETELVIIVTAHLVKPLDIAKQTLPTDQFIEPNDFDFYLMGSTEATEEGKPAASPSSSSNPNRGMKLEGSFGHIVPK